jgi:hypothetical protein
MVATGGNVCDILKIHDLDGAVTARKLVLTFIATRRSELAVVI